MRVRMRRNATATFLMNERNDPEEARHKIDDAIRRYGEWGAAKKVLLLREQHKDLWVKPTEVVLCSERIAAQDTNE